MQNEYSTFHLNADDMNDSIVQSIKALYKGKKIELVVSEEIDETSYLLSSDANKDFLLNAIKDVEKDENLVLIDIENIKKQL